MKIYSYVVRYDDRFAPNPTGKYCTLACCKPVIRRVAKVGDCVVGTGSVENVGNGMLIYAMKATEKMIFDEYFGDRRFKNRIDNIYHKDISGNYIQVRNKYHNTKKQMKHDLNGTYVLISNDFYYFGKDALEISAELKWIIKKGPWHKSCFTEEQKEDFVKWIRTCVRAGQKSFRLTYP